MSDQHPEDFLGLNDPDQVLADLTPALFVPARCGGYELRMLDAQRMDADEAVRDHWRIPFLDDKDEWEEWDGRSRPETQQKEIWARRMSWPPGTWPTPSQVDQWLANRTARLDAKWAPRLQWARDRDAAALRGECDPG